MGHAGAIISGSSGTADEKTKAFEENGIRVRESSGGNLRACRRGVGRVARCSGRLSHGCYDAGAAPGCTRDRRGVRRPTLCRASNPANRRFRTIIRSSRPHGHRQRVGYRRGECRWTAHVGFVNLGSHHRGRGLVACLAGEPDRAGARPRLTWVAWGLSRPSVNLFLAPELASLSTGLKTPVTHDAVLELVSSKSILESNIESTVRVEHVMEPLTYRIYPDTPVGEVQHLPAQAPHRRRARRGRATRAAGG